MRPIVPVFNKGIFDGFRFQVSGVFGAEDYKRSNCVNTENTEINEKKQIIQFMYTAEA